MAEPATTLDPTKLFVVSAITRGGVAADFNEYLENCAHPDRLAPNDALLTDELCQEYADGLGDLPGETAESDDEAQQELVYDLLTEKLGFTITLTTWTKDDADRIVAP